MHETALHANISHLSSKYRICLTSDSRGRILSAFALVPLSSESTDGLACVAWQFSNFLSNLSASAQSDKAAKTSRNPQAPRGYAAFGARYRRFAAFLARSYCLKTAKLRRPLNDVQINPQQLHDDKR